MTPEALSRCFHAALPPGLDFASVRFVDERTELLEVRDDVVQPPAQARDVGAMVTVHHAGGLGYAATPDLSVAGLREAAARAAAWADASRRCLVFDPRRVVMPALSGRGASQVDQPWDDVPWADRMDRLVRACRDMAVGERIVARSASVMAVSTESVYLSTDGAEVVQQLRALSPELEAYAHHEGRTERRTLGGIRGATGQGGMEVLDRTDFNGQAVRIGTQALELLDAAPCPSGRMHVLLLPDQMALQIHESIGHPIELDRILGDERNYAGTSFVRPEMFGSYQYGSELLNVSFDPDCSGELANYAYDDDGVRAERLPVIEAGILVRGLGGVASQMRSGLPGVAASRASTWNRPPIDRMANLNVEPGASTMEQLVGSVERGVWMETNLSWSIDDSRNKFQFGVEYAREIVDGELGRVVRGASYRGISAQFWRSLVGVGDASTLGVFGTPFCGKGEPNQVIRVGHASPPCLFADVDVVGGAA